MGVNRELRSEAMAVVSSRGDSSPTLWTLPSCRGWGECWYYRLNFSRLRAAISSGVAMVSGAPVMDTERRWVALSGAR